ncbi:MAG: hypothetical protein R3B45_02475 [Bdellovibrionota bacterium]
MEQLLTELKVLVLEYDKMAKELTDLKNKDEDLTGNLRQIEADLLDLKNLYEFFR